jgi:hypothetical protein
MELGRASGEDQSRGGSIKVVGVKSDEFIREVDEELQRDRLARLWTSYGRYVIAAAVLLVVGTAGWVGWEGWQERRLEAAGARLAAAEALLSQGKPREAADAFAAIASEASDSQAALARLREADALIAAGDAAGASRAMDAVAGAEGGDPIIKDMATLIAAGRELDTGDPASLRARLEPIAASATPWRLEARELLALLDLRAGEVEAARQRLTALSKEAGVTPDQQRRVDELLAAIGGPTKATS